MTRIKIAGAALFVPFVAVPLLLASCVTDRSTESAETMNTMDASTEEVIEDVIEELDPNDPDVQVCPVTGQMQRKSDADGSESSANGGGHGEGHGGDMDV